MRGTRGKRCGRPTACPVRARLTFAQALATSFLGLIATGTLLLPLDDFFDATSAVCFTGLVVVTR